MAHMQGVNFDGGRERQGNLPVRYPLLHVGLVADIRGSKRHLEKPKVPPPNDLQPITQ
jgi:hypothetical protein